MQEQIDINKETIFYASKLVTRGLMLVSFVIGLFTYSELKLEHSLNIFLIMVIFACLFIFVWMFYKGIYNPLILKVNKDGIYIPSIGEVSWRDVVIIQKIEPSFFEDDGKQSFGITLYNGEVYRINMFFFSVSSDKIVAILKKYQGDI